MLARVNASRVPYTVPPSTAAARLPVHCEHHDGPGTASEGDAVEYPRSCAAVSPGLSTALLVPGRDNSFRIAFVPHACGTGVTSVPLCMTLLDACGCAHIDRAEKLRAVACAASSGAQDAAACTTALR